ncbi:hypothetical protein [Mesorhizobium sp. M1273]|uniref:hypothetical protein n=1 Tax=Mesorhizobium sp. M1273 TaxID=2957075 RepID=UPI003337F81B
MNVLAKQLGTVQPDWAFEANPRMGGAVGEAYTNTLASSGMHPEWVVAREAIQNSVDARDGEDRKVAVEFVSRALTGKAKSAFIKAAGLGAIAGRSDRLGFREPNCIGSLSNPQAPLRLLFVNDHNTTGLAGDPSSSDSKFYRFLLTLGDGGKEHSEHGTGGSYGYGKSVYSSNSGILTIFAYSRTKDSAGEPISILFGCGYYRKHKHSERTFTGRAWFGHDKTPGLDAQPVVEPLLGDEADEMAAALGFEQRDLDDLGTSVLIVDSLLNSQGILEGVEDWWWPRLISHKLDVKVIGEDGGVSYPRPRKRDQLRPFLEAFDIAAGISPTNNKTHFQKTVGKNEGTMGLTVLEQTDDGDFVVGEARADAVALIRAPLMVVAYHRAWNVGSPTMAGAFIASDGIDDILRSAEPPAHDRWDPDARRLQDQTGEKKAIVSRVLSSIRRAVKNSQKTAIPPPPPRPKRLTLLERTLASFLTPSKKGTPPKHDASAAPIHLTYDKEPRAEADGASLRLRASFSVRMKAEESDEPLRIRVRISCPVIEDGHVGESLAVKIAADVALEPDSSDPDWSVFQLPPDTSVKFKCDTEAYNPLWTVRFVPEIEAVGEQ